MTTERALVDLFHEALDAEDVAGPFQRLQLELEKPTGAARARRARRTLMTRNRLALLAAAVVMVIAAGVLVGTRLSSNHRTTQIPAHTASVHTIDQAAVAQLLAKPLHFQTLNPGDQCPDSSNPDNGYFGAGPAYGIANGVSGTSAWGTYWSVSIVTPLGTPGPVVVRARDLTHGSPVLDIGQYGAGPIYASDVYQGKTVNQFQAVAFDTDGATKSNFILAGNHPYVLWTYLQGFKKNWGGGCVGAEIDGPGGFSEIFYADVPNN